MGQVKTQKALLLAQKRAVALLQDGNGMSEKNLEARVVCVSPYNLYIMPP
jgi:hypothetical protein